MSTAIIPPTHQLTRVQLTRDQVLDLIESSWVEEKEWASDNDAYESKELGECYALLKCGCAFQAFDDGENIGIRISYRGFEYFYEDQKVFSAAMYSVRKGA